MSDQRPPPHPNAYGPHNPDWLSGPNPVIDVRRYCLNWNPEDPSQMMLNPAFFYPDYNINSTQQVDMETPGSFDANTTNPQQSLLNFHTTQHSDRGFPAAYPVNMEAPDSFDANTTNPQQSLLDFHTTQHSDRGFPAAYPVNMEAPDSFDANTTNPQQSLLDFHTTQHSNRGFLAAHPPGGASSVVRQPTTFTPNIALLQRSTAFDPIPNQQQGPVPVPIEQGDLAWPTIQQPGLAPHAAGTGTPASGFPPVVNPYNSEQSAVEPPLPSELDYSGMGEEQRKAVKKQAAAVRRRFTDHHRNRELRAGKPRKPKGGRRKKKATRVADNALEGFLPDNALLPEARQAPHNSRFQLGLEDVGDFLAHNNLQDQTQVPLQPHDNLQSQDNPQDLGSFPAQTNVQDHVLTHETGQADHDFELQNGLEDLDNFPAQTNNVQDHVLTQEAGQADHDSQLQNGPQDLNNSTQTAVGDNQEASVGNTETSTVSDQQSLYSDDFFFDMIDVSQLWEPETEAEKNYWGLGDIYD
ncbi:hypothetical protein QBC41DRAFT_298619 [Cercophora samala]|uniref:Uncharacterized protein n=1 Tax=Cercophora samala TaxID=330535 RepID=A0AA39ZLQ4_9PEZI|nr:hypothetical protein QBC41DRAFT_298619 [Cercophora samala]